MNSPQRCVVHSKESPNGPAQGRKWRFGKRYEPLVIDRKLTTVFRPGNRVFPNYRGYKLNEVITARIIEQPGSDQKNIPPQFNDIKMPIQIMHIEPLSVHELEASHFEGSSPDVQCVTELLDHLVEIYQRPISEYGDQVTRIAFNYLRIAKTA